MKCRQDCFQDLITRLIQCLDKGFCYQNLNTRLIQCLEKGFCYQDLNTRLIQGLDKGFCYQDLNTRLIQCLNGKLVFRPFGYHFGWISSEYLASIQIYPSIKKGHVKVHFFIFLILGVIWNLTDLVF